jgi:hypothetical protein
MTKISLTPEQKARINPIKMAGGYQSLSAVIGALIAIYGDDLLRRVTIDPSTTLLVPTATPLVPPSTLSVTVGTVPTNTLSVPATTPSVPNTTPSVPTGRPPRVKFEI